MVDTPTRTPEQVRPAPPKPAPMTRPDPFDMIDSLREEMARLWSSAWPFGPWTTSRAMREMMPTPTSWSPRADVFERDGALVVKAELPGVAKDDISVTLENEGLVIRGMRKAEKTVKNEDYHRVEMTHGSFYRYLPLPANVDMHAIKATHTDGILEVVIPRMPGAMPKPTTIPVR